MNKNINYSVNWKEFGKRIRIRREMLKMSQMKLARKADISINTLRNLESKFNCSPTYETIVRIANALGLSLDDLNSGCLTDADSADTEDDIVRYDFYIITHYEQDGKMVVVTEIVDRDREETQRKFKEYMDRIFRR